MRALIARTFPSVVAAWALGPFVGVACGGESGKAVELVLQRGAEIEVLSVDYSPDGRIVAAAGESETIRLWDRSSGDLVRTLPGHRERVVDVTFSPDGSVLASSSTDGTVKIWDYQNGRLLHELTEHAGNWTRRVAFSPDSTRFTAASYDGSVSVWDTASGAVQLTLPTGVAVVDVHYTPDGQFIVTASRDHAEPLIQFWHSESGKPGLKLDHGSRLDELAISRDGRVLASSGHPGIVNLWELPSGRLLRRIEAEERAGLRSVDISPDGRFVALGSKWTNEVYEVATGALVSQMRGHEDGTFQVRFSPDGEELASASADASVRLWDVRSGAVRRIFAPRPPDAPITTIAISPDGLYEAVGGSDGVVRVWEARTGRFCYELRRHEGPVLTLEFSLDNRWLYSGSADRTIRVWDVEHGTISAVHPYFDRSDAIGALSCGGTEGFVASASGPYASATLDPTIKIWPSHYDRPIRTLRGHEASVRTIAYAPGTDRLASASADGTLKSWDVRAAQCLRTRAGEVLTEVLRFSPDGRWLLAGEADGTVCILDPGTLEVDRKWQAHRRPVQALAFSGRGRFLATAGAEGEIAVWNWESGAEIRRFEGIDSQFHPLAFRPDEPVLAFARRNHMVVHANVESGEILFQRVHFPDGEWLAWNPKSSYYMSSPRGDAHARLRFSGQLLPVYPLSFYREELRENENLLGALAGPAPALKPKNLRLWWDRYPYKLWWFYGLSGIAVCWVGVRLRRGWLADQRRRAQERVSRELVVSQEAERKRVAAELHDGLGQDLLVIKNHLYLATQRTESPERARELEEISHTVSQAISEVREISQNLRPYQLDRLGLTKAIRAVAQKVVDSGAVQLVSEIAEIDDAFPPDGEINFFRIVQESLNNVLKHSDAATAHLTIRRGNGSLRLRIEDDGRGFDYRRTMSKSNGSRGFGLMGLSERVRILGGRFECDSVRGEGTRLTFDFPLASSHENAN